MVTNEGDAVWRPAADVFDTEQSIVIHIDLPGIPKSEINIDATPTQLTIHGHHKGNKPFESATSRVRERQIGRFRKVVFLPQGSDVDHIDANYRNGLLEISVPKGATMNRRQIQVD